MADRPKTNNGSDFTVRGDQHRGKTATISGNRNRGTEPVPIAAGDNTTGCTQRRCVQESSTIHRILRNKSGIR
jgi:hypothetical protein